MFRLYKRLTTFLANYFKGTNFDHLINYYEYRQWLNSKTSDQLKSMYTEATYTPKSLFDFYKEEKNK